MDDIVIPESPNEDKENNPFIKEKSEVSPDLSNKEEDIIPDWLRPSSPTANTHIEEENTPETSSEIDTDNPKIIIPPADAELPDWLKDSVESPEKEIKEEIPLDKPKKSPSAAHKTKRIP